MQIRIRQTGAVMYEAEFRALFPTTSMPQQLTEAIINSFDADVVFEGPQAQPTRYQVAFADGVEQIDGKWYTKSSVTNMDVDGIAATDAAQAAAVRSDRNTRLSASDWTQVADAPVDQAAWAAYRQALRDISGQSEFPWTINWPTQPE
jgi:hypothetical protein